jgi:hypothetical protein
LENFAEFSSDFSLFSKIKIGERIDRRHEDETHKNKKKRFKRFVSN